MSVPSSSGNDPLAGFFALLKDCTFGKKTESVVDTFDYEAAERESALFNAKPYYIQSTSIVATDGIVTEIDTRKPFYTECEFGLPGPYGSTRKLFVNGRSCASVFRGVIQRVARLAPFSEEERKSMPFADVRVYDSSYNDVGTVKELTGKEGSLRACGFEPQTQFQGYLEPYKSEQDGPCSFIPDFLAKVMKTRQGSLQS